MRGDLYRRMLMADVIGVALLLDYLPQTPPLSIIALEALEILASGPNAKVAFEKQNSERKESF